MMMTQEWMILKGRVQLDEMASLVQLATNEGRSIDAVERVLGIESVRRLEQMSVSMAASVPAFRESVPQPPAEEEGAILVLTADGKGIPQR